MTNTQLPPLARQALDRDNLLRDDPELISKLRTQASARVLVMYRGKVLASQGTAALVLSPMDNELETELVVYLGRTTSDHGSLKASTPICLAVVSEKTANQIEPVATNWVSLRATGAGLSDLEAGIFTQALALNNWHQSHRFCPGCGSPTEIEKAGWVRRCLKEDLELFPRTDPAVIVCITDQQDRILLGSQGIWEQNRWSILAGFVEPGESLEAAVVREMKEESGLDVFEPKYIYSQSWPYPASLMLGFSASADSTKDLKPDGEEIVRLRWFSRTELEREALSILLPGRASISRAMIERWLGKQIESATEILSHG